MIRQRIVYTRPDHGVSIVIPTLEVMQALTLGGGYVRPSRRHWEIEKLVRDGLAERVAARWIDGLMNGGLTSAEALERLRDKDVPIDAAAVEVLDITEIPCDRWFRDAWTRSHNGGPIYIDLDKARRIQAQRILGAQDEYNKRVDNQIGLISLIGGAPAVRIELDTPELCRTIQRARHPEELRAIWPKSLPVPL